MRTLRISFAGSARQGFDVSLALADGPAGPFVPVPGGGPLSSDFSPIAPVDDPEFPGKALTLERVVGLQHQRPVPTEVGHFLHELLGGRDALREWYRLRAEGPLFTLIDIADDKGLAPLHRLPWERLLDESDDFIALSTSSPMARWQDQRSLSPTAMDWPIRVLIAQCAQPDEESSTGLTIAAEAERLSLERLFASSTLRYDVEYDVLEFPTPADIVRACDESRPHVLHFIGHALGEGPPAQHALSLWQPGAAGQPGSYVDWTLPDIRMQLRDKAPRVVFLNACRSSSAHQAPASAASLAQAFMKAGSVATLGMQGDIAGDLAEFFAGTFYRTLFGDQNAAGLGIHLATQKARLAMSGHRNTASVVGDADWAYPVLTLRVPPEDVLPRPPQQRETAWAPLFAARLPQRRATHDAVRCCSQAQPGLSLHAAVIVGEPGSGKSHLAAWSAQACKRAGMVVVPPIKFMGQDKVDWLDALRWIRDGARRRDGSPPLAAPHWPLPASAFREFNWGLNQRQTGRATFEAAPAGTVNDTGRALSQCTPPEDFARDTLQSFCEALAACATQSGLLLTLDQLEGVENGALTETLISGLVRPIALGQLSGVRLLLVMSQAQYDACRDRIESIPSRPRVIRVPLLQRSDFDRLARQLCHQWSPTLYGQRGLREMMALVLSQHGGLNDWGAAVFERLCELFRLISPQNA